ncbi:MAG: hypothetical protein ACLR23_16700 [Clostridia bacterium]
MWDRKRNVGFGRLSGTKETGELSVHGKSAGRRIKMKKRRFFQSSRSELICPMEKSAGRRIKTKKRRFFQSSRSELFCPMEKSAGRRIKMKKRRFFQSSRSELFYPMEKSAGRRIKTKKRRFFQSSRSELFCLVLVCIVYGCSLHQYGKAYRAAAAREIQVTDETKAMGTIYSGAEEKSDFPGGCQAGRSIPLKTPGGLPILRR